MADPLVCQETGETIGARCEIIDGYKHVHYTPTNGEVWAEHGHPNRPCLPPEAVGREATCRLQVATVLPGCAREGCGQEECATVHMTADGHDYMSPTDDDDTPPAEAIRCWIHEIPDCSPILNGCNIPTRLAAAYRKGYAAGYADADCGG